MWKMFFHTQLGPDNIRVLVHAVSSTFLLLLAEARLSAHSPQPCLLVVQCMHLFQATRQFSLVTVVVRQFFIDVCEQGCKINVKLAAYVAAQQLPSGM